jgi:hypothetical protein
LYPIRVIRVFFFFSRFFPLYPPLFITDNVSIMENHINFDDNIFILNTEIRKIQDILCLDAEPSLFLEKTMAEVDFLNRALEFLAQNLAENRMLIDREEELDKLADLEWRYEQLLTSMHNQNASISVPRFPAIREKLDTYKEASVKRRRFIDSSRLPDNRAASEPLVSTHEMSELLRDF